MPVPSKIRSMFGDDDEMEDARLDEAVAPGTRITLARRIGLDGRDDLV
jgi:hypothetical protein